MKIDTEKVIEERENYYLKALEWYSEYGIISKSEYSSINTCFNNYIECHENSMKFTKNLRCKRRSCPICDEIDRSAKYFEIMKKIENFKNRYLIFILTINGKNVEIDDKNRLQNELNVVRTNFNKLVKSPFLKKTVKGYLRVMEIAYNPERNSFLPHLHILLFTIKGIYKHFKMKELKEMIQAKWNILNGFKTNVHLEKLGTEEKIQKTVSYLTHSKKKRLKNFFDNDENKAILSAYLNIIKRKRIYHWSKFKE